MIVSITVSNFINIYQVLTTLHQLICRGPLILGYGVRAKIARPVLKSLK